MKIYHALIRQYKPLLTISQEKLQNDANSRTSALSILHFSGFRFILHLKRLKFLNQKPDSTLRHIGDETMMKFEPQVPYFAKNDPTFRTQDAAMFSDSCAFSGGTWLRHQHVRERLREIFLNVCMTLENDF